MILLTLCVFISSHGKLNTKIIRNEDPYLTSGITQQQYTKKKCDNQQVHCTFYLKKQRIKIHFS